jgi:hypothetical protein
MQYFNSFNDVLYKFGNEASTVLTQDLSAYVSLIDEKGYIPEGMRPDQLSYQLYGTTIYHWTFYLLNDELRLQGWPLTTAELDETIKHEFGHTTLTTRVDITSKFKEGQTVSGSASGATGTIVHRVLDFGQIVLKDAVGTFRAGEAVTSVNSSFETESIVIVSGEKEYNAAHHYISNSLSDTIVDIDPAIGPGQLVTEVTNYEWYTEENNKLRNIKVIRPNIISTLVSSYKQALKK